MPRGPDFREFEFDTGATQGEDGQKDHKRESGRAEENILSTTRCRVVGRHVQLDNPDRICSGERDVAKPFKP